MLFIVIICFLGMFALVAVTIGVGFNYLEAQKKKKVAEMLQTASGTQVAAETKVLLAAGPDKMDALKKFLAQFDVFNRVESKIQQAGLNWSVNAFLAQSIVLGIIGALVGTRFPMFFAGFSSLAMAFGAGMLPYLYVMRQRAKRMAAFEEQFPDALDFLGRAMRAGHAFSISLEMLADESPAPLGLEFRKVFNEHNLGMPIETALTNLTGRVPLLDVRFFVSAVLLQRETGGNLAEILAKLAHVIRERFKLKGQVRAASAHGRITGAILTIMPVALMLGLLLVAPGYLQGMAADSDGKYLIGGAIVGILLGHFCIQKIIDIKV